MEHGKLIIIQDEDRGDICLYPENWTEPGQDCIAVLDPDDMEQARRLVKCWNEHDDLVEALERIRDLETDCCQRCEGNGQLYADGKAHFPSEDAPTIHCGNCGGSGRILPEDAQEIAAEILAEAEKD